MSLFPVFGKTPTGPRLQRIRHSSHYSNGSFQNLVPTDVTAKDASFLKMLREYRNRPADTKPPKPLPSVSTDLSALPNDQASIVWFGHSSYLLKIAGTHILVDPVFSGNASPVSFFAKAFPGSNVYGVDQMPATLEAVILTHDHYDHLDYKTILQLKDRTNHFYTSLGVGAHLEFWGVDPSRITELDWWESCGMDAHGHPVGGQGVPVDNGDDRDVRTSDATRALTLTATPARHFSGRSIKRGAATWSSFVLEAPGYKLFLGGDSGYEQHFKAIGDRFGPFDLTILECGQYGKNWPFIHMLPEQTVQAALDLRAATLFPVHWGKFTLALHPWDEPIRRVTAAAARAHLSITTPRIGEIVTINHKYPNEMWYNFL